MKKHLLKKQKKNHQLNALSIKKTMYLIRLSLIAIVTITFQAKADTKKNDYLYSSNYSAEISEKEKQEVFNKTRQKTAEILAQYYRKIYSPSATNTNAVAFQKNPFIKILDKKYFNIKKINKENTNVVEEIIGMNNRGLIRIGNKANQMLNVQWKKLRVFEVLTLKPYAQLLTALTNYSEFNDMAIPANWKQTVLRANRYIKERLEMSTLSFEGDLNDAIIEVNGLIITNNRILLTPGKHFFVITKNGYRKIGGKISISAGEIRYLPIKLIEIANEDWPVKVTINSKLREFEKTIFTQLQLLDFETYPESPYEINFILTSKRVLQDKANKTALHLTITLKQEKIVLHTSENTMEVAVSIDEPNWSLDAIIGEFIQIGLINFASGINRKHTIPEIKLPPPLEVLTIVN